MKNRHVDGTLLRELRLRAHLTQRQLAVLADVRPESISRLENGVPWPFSDLSARKLADALGAQVQAFTRPGPYPNREPVTGRGRRNPAA